MKKTAHIIASFVLGFMAYVVFAATAYAETWTILPSGVTNDLNNLSCPTASTCYAVGGAPFIGGAGIVLKTVNGGDTWSAQTIPTTNPIRGISCPSVSLCYAAGDGAAVLKTINGGETWTLQSVPNQVVPYGPRSAPWFWDIWTVDSGGSTAVAVGNVGAVYRTVNGGSSWVQIDVGAIENLHGVFFANESTGWIMGSGGKLLKTTDGGASWRAQTPGISSLLWDMESLDGGTAWLSGGEMRKTVNGGDSWVAMTTPVYVTYRGIEFINASLGWAVGSAIVKTTNGGETWTWETSPTGVILRDIECESETLCFAVGDDGVIIRTAAPVPPAPLPVARPDLTATISSLACGSAPSYFHYIVSVANVGTAAAGPFTVKVESINASGEAIGTATTHSSSSLAAGTSAVYDNSIPPDFFNPSGAQSVTVRARADTLQEVAESNEDNNSATLTTTCAIAQTIPAAQTEKKEATPDKTSADTSTKPAETTKETANELIKPTEIAKEVTDKPSEPEKAAEPIAKEAETAVKIEEEKPIIKEGEKSLKIEEKEKSEILEEKGVPQKEGDSKKYAQYKKERQSREERIEKIKSEAPKILVGIEKFIEEAKVIREENKEKFAEEKINSIAKHELTTFEEKKKEKVTDAMKTFIAYGTDTTKILGPGERAGVIASYKKAFGKLPENKEEWEDVIKLGNGRFPAKKNEAREKYAEDTFKKIYLRAPERTNQNDNAAVVMIAYGLRPIKRDVKAEAASIKIFKMIFAVNPKTAEDWDIVRAIAYSGAKR